MLSSNLITDRDHFHNNNNISNRNSYHIEGTTPRNNQNNVQSMCASSSSSIASHTSPTLIRQSDPWPHEATSSIYENTSRTQPNSSDSINYDFSSSDMTTKQWQTADANSTTQSILSQALPAPLAAPTGWRSEVISSSSPIPDHMGTNLINSNTNFTERYDEYKTLNTPDAPPIIFSSTNEANRVIDEMSSSRILPSTTFSSTSSGYSNQSSSASAFQEPKRILTQDQQQFIKNVDTQQPPPLVLHKKLPNNLVTYQQTISVRYLQPPTPPPPEPIIIREVRPPPPPAQSPVKIRQRPPPPSTPPPLVFRERPPPVPPRLPSRVVEKLLPPPPPPPRRMIVERYASCPPKPADVFIERWLPYRRSDRRRIFFERAPAPYRPPQEPNLLIVHDQPHARIHKEFINQGVVREDPQSYLQRYGPELSSWQTNSQYAHLIGEAARALPGPPPQFGLMGNHQYQHEYQPSYPNRYPSSSSPIVASAWDKMKSVPYISHPPPYHQDNSQYNSPYNYATQSPYGHGLNSYDSYPAYTGNFPTMMDRTSPWGSYCRSSSTHSYLPPYPVSSSSSYPPTTIRVNSDGELQHVLHDLTNGRVPTPLRSY